MILRNRLVAVVCTSLVLAGATTATTPAAAAPATWDYYVDSTYAAIAASGGARFLVLDGTSAPSTHSEVRVDGARQHYSARVFAGPAEALAEPDIVDGVGYTARRDFLAAYGPLSGAYAQQVSAQTRAIAGGRVDLLTTAGEGPRTAALAVGSLLLDCRVPGTGPDCPVITANPVVDPGEVSFRGVFPGSSDTIAGSALFGPNGVLTGLDMVLMLDGVRYDWGWILARGSQSPRAPSGTRYDEARMVRALAARGIPPVPVTSLPAALRLVGRSVQAAILSGTGTTPVRDACSSGSAAMADQFGGVWRSRLGYSRSAYVCLLTQPTTGAEVRVSISRSATVSGRPAVVGTTYRWGAVRLTS